jgi:hypothetical protein
MADTVGMTTRHPIRRPKVGVKGTLMTIIIIWILLTNPALAVMLLHAGTHLLAKTGTAFTMFGAQLTHPKH